MTPEIKKAIERAAQEHALDPKLVLAIVMVESEGKPKAFRYEAHKKDASYGLMQVMGQTARNLGMHASLRDAALCEPLIGLEYGCLTLTQNLGTMDLVLAENVKHPPPFPPGLRKALARYNGGGRGNPGPDGTLRNESYVQKVETAFQQLG